MLTKRILVCKLDEVIGDCGKSDIDSTAFISQRVKVIGVLK